MNDLALDMHNPNPGYKASLHRYEGYEGHGSLWFTAGDWLCPKNLISHVLRTKF